LKGMEQVIGQKGKEKRNRGVARKGRAFIPGQKGGEESVKRYRRGKGKPTN